MNRVTRLAGRLAAVAVTAALLTPVTTTTAAAVVCPAPGGSSIPEAAAPAGAEVAFLGHGYGHSLGMSQYGAQGAARLGCTHEQILGTYYAGSVIATKVMPTEMKVWMLVDGTAAEVQATTAPVTWSLSACTTACPPVQPPGSTWRMQTDAAKTFFELIDVTTDTRMWRGGLRGQTVTAAHSGSVIEVDTFRGAAAYLSRELRYDELRFGLDAAGLDALEVIKAGHVADLGRTVSAMDKYLWGIAEVPLSWTRDAHEALKAQVLAARTYAYAKSLAGITTLYPTMANQHYTGYAKEREDKNYRDQYSRNFRWADAVLSTSDKVLMTAAGKPVETFFTSSMGGYSEDAKYVWGNASVAGIRAFDDSTWDLASSGSTYRSWARGFTRAEVAAKLGFSTLTSISVAPQGTTARLAGVTVTGTIAGVATTKVFTGDQIRIKVGLPSPGFTVSLPVAIAAAPARTVIGTASTGSAGGNLTATVRWSAPTGSADVTSYRIQAVNSGIKAGPGKTLTFVVPGSKRSVTVALPKGTYTFTVRAENGVGAGPYSAVSNPATAR